MSEKVTTDQASGGVVKTRLHGIELLLNSRLNKGTAEAVDDATLRERIRAYVWEPVYHPYERIL
jgi:hypothetical protein